MTLTDEIYRQETRFLTLEDVVRCGGSDIVAAAKDIEEGFHLLQTEKILQPSKTTLKRAQSENDKSEGLVNILSALVANKKDSEIYGFKALGAMPPNVEKGLPRATGIITLFDPETKSPVAIMDAQVISATRTGAVTMLAAKKLANPKTESIGLVGAGVNMKTQLLALKEALPNLKEVQVYSRGESKYRFAEKMSEKTGVTIIPVQSAQQAVSDKQLVVTCLPNVLEPVVRADWIKDKGVTCINIGCYESQARLLKRMDRIVADMWEQGKHRGVQTHAQAFKKGYIKDEQVEDLAPILTGQIAGRQDDDENIFFAPTGLGFQDIVVAWRVYQNALEKNIGANLSLWQNSEWI